MERTRQSQRWLIAAVVVFAMGVAATVVGGPRIAIPIAIVLVGVLTLGGKSIARATTSQARSDVAGLSAWNRVTQAWWAPIAVSLAVVEILMGIGVFINGENLSGRIIGGLVLLPGAGLLTLCGLWIRPRVRPTGNVLILVGTLPWFALFWMVVPPLVGLVVWIGVFTSGFSVPRPSRAVA